MSEVKQITDLELAKHEISQLRAELNQIAIAGHQLMELIKTLEQPGTQAPADSDHLNDNEPLDPLMHTVLHIEDNETNFRLVECILEDRPNIELLWAPTGEGGIELAGKHAPA